jgi:hypothetical protein
VVLSGGAGVQDWDAFRGAARALEAVTAGSAATCDGARLPAERLVGSSGAVIAPRIYLALGISGAPHHRYGAERSEYLLAVNRDRYAPIVAYADLTVLADVQELLPLLAAGDGREAVELPRGPRLSHEEGEETPARRIEVALDGVPRCGPVIEADSAAAAAIVRTAVAAARQTRNRRE